MVEAARRERIRANCNPNNPTDALILELLADSEERDRWKADSDRIKALELKISEYKHLTDDQGRVVAEMKLQLSAAIKERDETEVARKEALEKLYREKLQLEESAKAFNLNVTRLESQINDLIRIRDAYSEGLKGTAAHKSEDPETIFKACILQCEALSALYRAADYLCRKAKTKEEKGAGLLSLLDALDQSDRKSESEVHAPKGNYFCLDPKCGWIATKESRPLSRGLKVGCPVCKGDADYK